MRILFVENHETFVSTVIPLFLAAHDVVVVSSVRDALVKILEGGFDLCLVDFDLDDAKGDEFVRVALERGTSAKMIGVSSHDEGNAKLLAAGAEATCKKTEFAKVPALLAALFPEM